MADNEIAQKEAAVAAQGDAVRELKANGGSGEGTRGRACVGFFFFFFFFFH